MMRAKFILGYSSPSFEIKDYHIDESTGMVTLIDNDGDEILIHKTKVIIMKEGTEKQ